MYIYIYLKIDKERQDKRNTTRPIATLTRGGNERTRI
jgi:hypothetical protein